MKGYKHMFYQEMPADDQQTGDEKPADEPAA